MVEVAGACVGATTVVDAAGVVTDVEVAGVVVVVVVAGVVTVAGAGELDDVVVVVLFVVESSSAQAMLDTARIEHRAAV